MHFASIRLFKKFVSICGPKCRFLKSSQIVNAVWTRSASSRIRNIGIMAHIDAGKTTTTERMLYYAGYIMRMGDIDAGDTVMDYLPTERERGITIQSAAISFNWLDAHINLIDTPGHVDFTIEVERSLRVLDGAVAIFDAAKGVEAQSRTVWRQADRHNIPRIAYINKMDKPGASLTGSIQSLKNQLKANTALLQLPLMEHDRFCGIIDIVGFEKSMWDLTDMRSNRSGRPFSTKPLDSSDPYWEPCLQAREVLIEQLCDLYDDVAETWLEGKNAGDVTSINPCLLRRWIRRATLERTIVPVFCGSSLKNIAVQPLLNAVVHYLPKPTDIHHNFTKFYQNSLSAMAFKVVFNKRQGPLIFVRVYSGKLENGMTIYNANKSCSEKVTGLMSVFADDFRNVATLKAGSIGLVSGLKATMTGDTLVESENAFATATSLAMTSSTDDDANENEHSLAVLAAVPVHEPVFFCTVEVQSITQEKALAAALEVISREDPSVRVEYLDNGTIVLSGMGELHMDIVVERIKKDFKVDAYIGPLQVAYREIPTEAAKYEEHYERTVLGKSHHVHVNISVRPQTGLSTPRSTSDIVLQSLAPTKQAAAQGIVQACQKGLILGYPVMEAAFKIRSVKTSDGCPPALVTAAAYKCTHQALELAQCQLVEPVMNVQVNTASSVYDNTVNLLNKHHAEIKDLATDDDDRILFAQAPVASMKGFSSSLRSATSGLADFTLEMAGYQPVSDDRLLKIRNELSGMVS